MLEFLRKEHHCLGTEYCEVLGIVYFVFISFLSFNAFDSYYGLNASISTQCKRGRCDIKGRKGLHLSIVVFSLEESS